MNRLLGVTFVACFAIAYVIRQFNIESLQTLDTGVIMIAGFIILIAFIKATRATAKKFG